MDAISQNIKLVKIAPWIYNIQPFIHREHPLLHPETPTYMKYWEEQEKRSIEGFWGLDQAGDSDKYNKYKPGGFRFMTPQHYWYTNFCFISHQEKGKRIPNAIQPNLRDIDWYVFYIYIIAQGFSGFELDTVYTCSELVKKYNQNDQSIEGFTQNELIDWHDITSRVYKKDGTLKKYIDPLKYLKSTFNKPLGKCLYDNRMRNVAQLSARGVGKSFTMMAFLSQAYNFAGCRTVDDFLIIGKGPTLCVGSALSSKSGELLEKFLFSQELLAENFGAYEDETGKFYPGFFHKEHTGSLAVGNGKKPYKHQFKTKRGNVWVNTGGTKTNIVHQSYDSNPEAFVGIRSILMLEDELGLNDKLLDSSRADETVMIMDDKIGIAWKSGTGGNNIKIQESRVLFYDPESYGYLAFDNHWENSKGKIGMFIPATYQNSKFRDPNGNQNMEHAFEQEMYERKIRSESDSTSALDGWIIARPLVPSEMFLSPEANIFPTTLLRQHRAELEAKDIIKTICSVGFLSYPTKEKDHVKWNNFTDKYHKPILTYDVKKYNGNLQSNIVIIEHPEDNTPNPTFSKSLYKITYDPYMDDGTGPSLAAIQVYKGTTVGSWNRGLQNTLVASYTGRYDKVEEVHEIAIKLALYYNARILVESNIPDFIRYCKRSNRYNLLQITPFEAISKFLKAPGNKYEVGLRINKTLNIQGEQLIRQWLLEERGTDPVTNRKILNLHHIYELRLLDELINYTRDNNTDAVSAFKLLMFWIFQENLVPTDSNAVTKRAVSKVDAYFKKHVQQQKTSERKGNRSTSNHYSKIMDSLLR